jgi:hypothetical protein
MGIYPLPSLTEREVMFPVTPVMHLTGGVHGLADKTGGPCGHQIPCFFSRPWRWYYYSPSPILTPTGRASCVPVAHAPNRGVRHLPPQASSNSAAAAPSPSRELKSQSRTQEAPSAAAKRCRLVPSTIRTDHPVSYSYHMPICAKLG